MKNLSKYFVECKKELDGIGIPYSKNIMSCTVNYRAKSRWGQCRRRGGTYSINISNRLLADNVPAKSLKQTIIHELLHTCPGCMKHTGDWKKWADVVNRKLGYHVSRLSSAEDLGVHDSVSPWKYTVVCTNCNKEVAHYQRKTKVVKYPGAYWCGICHQSALVVKES